MGAAAGAFCLPLQSFGANGYEDSISDCALKQFKAHYKSLIAPAQAGAPRLAVAVEAKALDPGLRRDDEQKQSTPVPRKRGVGKQAITKRAIFHYVYTVTHHSIYREKYAPNLKRVLPRIPFLRRFLALV